jgi:hypothetical protein
VYRLRRMTTHRSFIPFFALLLVAVGCGGGGTPAPAEAPNASETAPPAPDATPKQVEAPTATPAPDAAPKQVEAPTPAAAAPKASTFQIDGVSISDITGDQLGAALKKRGWETLPSPETHVGKYEQISIGARKDKTNKVVASVTISRTSKTPTPITDGTTESDFAPKALQAMYARNENIVQAYDPDSDVLVTVLYMKGGNTASAKTLLDALMKQPK